MNYDLRATERKYPLNSNIGMPYGDMPYSALTSKFEETLLPEGSGPPAESGSQYTDYARGLMMDRRPDENLFEHERSRGATNRSTGRIQLQYYGHRGNASDPAHPELFLGFAGPENRDPRGINVDPNMGKFRAQEEARGRYFRFSKDHADFTTSGRRSETREIADMQALNKAVKSRLKVFSSQLDGRREGLRRMYTHKSAAGSTQKVASYGELIADDALTPTKRAFVVSGKLLRDTHAYRNGCRDTDFHAHWYGATRGGARPLPAGARAGHTATDGDWDKARAGKLYKSALSVLMGELARHEAELDADRAESGSVARGKGTADESGNLRAAMSNREADSEFSTGRSGEGRRRGRNGPAGGVLFGADEQDYADSESRADPVKSAALKDVSLILEALRMDSDFGGSSDAPVRKLAARLEGRGGTGARKSEQDTEQRHLALADAIYKAAASGSDLRAIAADIAIDAEMGATTETNARRKGGGAGRHRRGDGGTRIEVNGEERATVNFRPLLAAVAGAAATGGEEFRGKSRGVRDVKTLVGAPGGVERDPADEVKWGDNRKKERFIGKHGGKFTRREIDFDAADRPLNEIS